MEKVFIGYCYHGIPVAGIASIAPEESLERFAAENREVRVREGALNLQSCDTCREAYVSNCKTLGLDY